MPSSYPQKGARVNTSAPKSSVPAAVASGPASRTTATFEPYFWEAYNEIVQPHRFDHYLIRKWLPELGPTAFAVIKTLRDHCYHNPQTGVLRNSFEMSMDELADAVGVSRASLFRLFTQNESLTQFVRRIEQHKMVDGKPKQDKNRFLVCMDTPIHPNDMERYDDLRAIKEQERTGPPARILKREKGDVSYESHFETHSGKPQKSPRAYESQNETHSEKSGSYESQIATPDTTYLQSHSATPLDNLPFGDSILIESLTPSAAPVINNAPKGGGENAEAERLTGWNEALPKLAEAMTLPTFQTHIKSLKPLGVTSLGEEGVEVALQCPSAFTREWIEKRHAQTIETVLAEVLGCSVAVRLTQAASGAKEAHRG